MFKKTLFAGTVLVLALSLLLPILQDRWPFGLGLDLAGGVMVTYRPDLENIPQTYADVPVDDLLAMAKETLAGRLRQRFETHPDVVVRSDQRIVVSLPGEHDQRRVLETVGQTYRLTFRQALASYASPPAQAEGLLLPHAGRWLDLGEELLAGDMLDARSIRVETADGLTVDSLGQGATIRFEFRPPFDERFAEITREGVGETLAILLDDRVEWAGAIEQEIRGPGILRGGYDVVEANEVASLLRSGNLPLALEVESLSGVGPSLGQELLAGGRAALVGSAMALALLVLLAYGHRRPLLIAGGVSLAALLFFTLGLISALGLTVDLVAIAGLVLSIGMGMDAFILVFEALERGGGEARRSALGRLRQVYGFGGEGRTLLHANGSTLLVVLLLFGSERLKSFAVFLVVGLVASLATILVTRAVLAWFARRGEIAAAGGGLLGRLRSARLGIYRGRHLYVAALVIFFLLTGWVLAARAPAPWLAWGSDFQPGLQMQISMPAERPIEPLLAELEGRLPGVEARHQAWLADSLPPGHGGHLITLEGEPWEAGAGGFDAAALGAFLAEQEVDLRGFHGIDARLSSQRILGSLSVLILSFALLAFYLTVVQGWLDRWWRPESAPEPTRAGVGIFAGTLLAVVVDLLVVLAALALLEVPLGMPVIAALLTIVGYSVNDSMVLWSHLSGSHLSGRHLSGSNLWASTEEGSASPRQRVSAGVDRIFSRTLLTSLSTMVPALAILVCGLEPLAGFAWAVLVGTFAGTLSSIFVVGRFAEGAVAGSVRPARRRAALAEGS